MKATLFHALSVALMLTMAQDVFSQDRLRIEVLPVYILPPGTSDQNIERPSNFYQVWPRSYTGARGATMALAATREAMDMLSVPGDKYDIVVAQVPNAVGDLIAFDAIECTYAQPDIFSTCTHPTKGAVEFHELYEWLGYENDLSEQPMRDTGVILLLVIVKNDLFPWDHHMLGQARLYSLTGFDPLREHWTTTTCTAWVHLDAPSVAHELGHCFGLDHNGAGDRNFDGVDNSVDLMLTGRDTAHPERLKPSNQERVSRHFRDLEENEEPATSIVPMMRTFD